MFQTTEAPGWAKGLIDDLDENGTNYRLRLQIPPCANQSAEGLEKAVETSKLALTAWLTSSSMGCIEDQLYIEVHTAEHAGHGLEADVYISTTTIIDHQQLYVALLKWFACVPLESAVLFQLYERAYAEMDFVPGSAFIAEYSPSIDDQ